MFQKFSCVLFPLVVWWPHISLCVMCVVYYSLCSWNLVLGPSLELIVAVAVLREAFSLLLGEPTWDHSKLACQLKISGQFSCSPTRMPFMGTNSHWQDLRQVGSCTHVVIYGLISKQRICALGMINIPLLKSDVLQWGDSSARTVLFVLLCFWEISLQYRENS